MEDHTISPRTGKITFSQSDQEIFGDAFEKLLTYDPHTKISAAAEFADLESLAHDIEFGVQLVQPDPLGKLCILARSSVFPGTRQCAVRVIASSLWNNPKALEAIKGSNLVAKLIDILKGEKDVGVRASLIFSISAAAAGEHGMQEFIGKGGSQLLRDVFAKDEPEVRGKCATFVEDNLPFNRAIDGVDDELSLWCRLFQQHLQNNGSDTTSEKVLSSLMFVLLYSN